ARRRRHRAVESAAPREPAVPRIRPRPRRHSARSPKRSAPRRRRDDRRRLLPPRHGGRDHPARRLSHSDRWTRRSATAARVSVRASRHHSGADLPAAARRCRHARRAAAAGHEQCGGRSGRARSDARVHRVARAALDVAVDLHPAHEPRARIGVPDPAPRRRRAVLPRTRADAMTRGRAFVLRGWMTWASVGAVLSVATLTWLGYRAVVEWQHSADVIDQRTADASADLLLTAVTRDMRAVQRTVLSTLQVGDASGPAALDLNAVASAFARYPYPDAYFVARITPQQPIISFYARTTRQPAWLPAASVDTPFPVVTVADSRIANQLLERIARDRHRRKPFSVFEARLGRARCQIVALLTYVDERGSVSIDVRGFIVDLEWVRRNYFQDLTSQIARMRVANPDLRLAIVDASGAVRAGAATAARTVSARRSFPLLFFDPAIVELDRPEDLATEWWNADATLTGRRSDAVRRGAWASLVIVSVSALALAASLGLSATALQARFRLTEARSDFVSAVTHELKTPTATIQTISESFVRRPHIDEATRRDYGRILLDETRRLARLIDNLLAHSRISDIAETYAF